jgi:hypothetical protein
MPIAIESARLKVPTASPGTVQRIRLYHRPLRVSEAVALHRYGNKP